MIEEILINKNINNINIACLSTLPLTYISCSKTYQGWRKVLTEIHLSKSIQVTWTHYLLFTIYLILYKHLNNSDFVMQEWHNNKCINRKYWEGFVSSIGIGQSVRSTTASLIVLPATTTPPTPPPPIIPNRGLVIVGTPTGLVLQSISL